jgi:hypothetical protein
MANNSLFVMRIALLFSLEKLHMSIKTSDEHLRRCIEMLFGVGTEQAKHLTDGDSQ